jgi:predicted Zn-dependent peptidase
MAIETYQFTSGLQVYTIERPHANTTSVNFVVKAGGLDETDREAGLSHLMEHVVHQGTDLFPDNTARLNYEEESMYSSQANTGLQRTHYFARGSDEQAIFRGLGSMVFDPSLATSDIEHECEVVTREAKMGADNQGTRFYFAALQSMVKAPYSRPVIGYVDALNFVTEEVRDYYNRQYSPSNIVVATAGKLSLSKAIQGLRELWPRLDDPISRSTAPTQRPDPVFFKPGTFWFPDTVSTSNTYLSVRAPLPEAIPRAIVDDQDYSYTIARQIMGSEVNRELRDERKLSYDGYFTYHTHWHPAAWMTEANVTVDTGKEEEALEAIEKTVQGCPDISDDVIRRKIKANLGSAFIAGDDIGGLAVALVTDLGDNHTPTSNEEYLAIFKQMRISNVREALAELAQQFTTAPRYTFFNSAEAPTGEAQEIQPQLH